MENNAKLRRSQGVHTNSKNDTFSLKWLCTHLFLFAFQVDLHQDSTSSSESEHAAPRLKVKPKMDRTSSEEDDKSSESIEQSVSRQFCVNYFRFNLNSPLTAFKACARTFRTVLQVEGS